MNFIMNNNKKGKNEFGEKKKNVANNNNIISNIEITINADDNDKKSNDNSIDIDDKIEEMTNKTKLELIGKVIDLGNDPKTKVCTKYNLGNKFLVIELIKTDCIRSQKVAEVMLEVDRNNFAPRNPYTNKPQYIGYNVTISAPHMHAHALEYLSEFCTKGAHILDIGSGSGFLTVALSKMTNDTGLVVGVEHIPEL